MLLRAFVWCELRAQFATTWRMREREAGERSKQALTTDTEAERWQGVRIAEDGKRGQNEANCCDNGRKLAVDLVG